MKPRPTCAVPDCGRPVWTDYTGLCRTHGDRLRQRGDVQAEKPIRAAGNPSATH